MHPSITILPSTSEIVDDDENDESHDCTVDDVGKKQESWWWRDMKIALISCC
jgi:hypothetical protein